MCGGCDVGGCVCVCVCARACVCVGVGGCARVFVRECMSIVST